MTMTPVFPFMPTIDSDISTLTFAIAAPRRPMVVNIDPLGERLGPVALTAMRPLVGAIGTPRTIVPPAPLAAIAAAVWDSSTRRLMESLIIPGGGGADASI